MNAQGLLRPHQPRISALHPLLECALVAGLLYACATLHAVRWREAYYLAALAGSVLYYFFAHHQGLYQSWRSQNLAAEARYVLLAWLLALAALLVLAWASKSSALFSRRVLGTWAVLTPLALLGLRAGLRLLLRSLRRLGRNTRRIAIAGAGLQARQLADIVSREAWMGLRLAGFFADEPVAADGPVLSGSLADLEQRSRAGEFDEIYIALPMSAEASIQRLVNNLSDSSIPVHVVPDLFTFNLINARLRTIGGLPVISVYDSPMDQYSALLKRGEDLLFGSLILLLAALPMALIALAIRLDSPGPVFFRQHRYGLKGEAIRVWKFRTMTVTEDGPVLPQATAADHRITRLGRWLRRCSLDELPQLFNVLAGQMSLVGPRPHAVAHNEAYRQRIDGYMLRHLVKPGITGWAQVNGWRGETDTLEKMEKRIEHDLYYIRHWSLWLDLKILLLTLVHGFVHRNAY